VASVTVPATTGGPASCRPARRAVRLGARLVSALGAALAAAMLLAPLLGYQRYVITGGSMTGSIDRGSIVFDRIVPTASLRVGDVITYAPPASSGIRGQVTHRIVAIDRDRRGRRVFATKGDANASRDPWRFSLRAHQARVAFHVPYAGYALAALSETRIRMILIGLPALLLGISLLTGLWNEAGAIARREATEGR
jgi:signal peptidase